MFAQEIPSITIAKLFKKSGPRGSVINPLPQKSAFAKNEPPGEEEIDYIGEGLNVDRLSPDKKSANGKGFSHIKRNLSNEFDQAIQIVEEGKYPILTNPFRIELAGLLYLRK